MKKTVAWLDKDSVEFVSSTESNGAMWPLKDGSQSVVYSFVLTTNEDPRYSFVLTEDKKDTDWRGYPRYDVSEVFGGLITTEDLEQKEIKILTSFHAANYDAAEMKAFGVIYDERLDEVAGCACVLKALSRDSMPLKLAEDLDDSQLAAERRESLCARAAKKARETALRGANALKAKKPAQGQLPLFA